MAALLPGITAVTIVLVVIARLEAAYRTARTFRGARVLVCPRDGAPAAVELHTGRAAVSAFFGRARLRPTRCTRWKACDACAGACVSRIEADPRAGLPRLLMARWIAGRACALCGCELQTRSAEFPPALLLADGSSIEWESVPLPRLPDALRTHRPICWHCHVVGTLHRERLDLFSLLGTRTTGTWA